MKIVGNVKMQGKSKFVAIILVTILLTSLSFALVSAQYTTATTTNVTIRDNGTFIAQETTTGVTFQITGAVGATGTVTTSLYDGNPQSSAALPSGISLAHFVSIVFNMSAHDFSSATVAISYSDSDVQNIKTPYSIYKYDVNSNSYIALQSTVDTSAKTITITLNSINDPLLAIGGTTIPSSGGGGGGISTTTWVILIVAIIIILLVTVFTVRILTKPDTNEKMLRKGFFR
jgi:hypothetical protein